MEGLTYEELKPLIIHCLDRDKSVITFGPPGTGKTTMAKEIADYFSLPMVKLLIGHREPAETGGFHYPNKEIKKVEWYTPNWFPDKPSLIFLDEINTGVTKQHQNPLYQIMNDKAIGDLEFPPGSKVMGAGNNEEDHSIAVTLSAALENRSSIFQLRPDVANWLRWAERKELASDYRAYIAFGREKALFEYIPGQHAFPSPRSNANAADLVDGVANDTMRKRLAASAIGDAHATKYMVFNKVYKNVNIKDVVEKGVQPELNEQTEESFLYAFVYSLASYISAAQPSKLQGTKAENIVKVMRLFSSKPEYQSTFFRMLIDMVGKKKGIFDVLRTVADFGPLASHLSTILSADA